ncbi:MAG: S9 family peptidase, partial [Acidimicrobiia bacterium]|nr:S9 family peptidase [Acidimicrobiia bacterium]
MAESFPRLTARTRRFTLGEPRTPAIAPDGSHVLFLRSRYGTDPVTLLWALDLDGGGERLVADPERLLADRGDLPEAEKRRRERARESAAGIVGYACDHDVTVAAYALGGQLFTTDVGTGASAGLDTAPGVFDPRPGPDGGGLVAYVAGPVLRLVGAGQDRADRELAGEPAADVSWGSAEFVAAEEMGRSRGFWWAPDSSGLIVARVDNAPV